MAMYCTDLAIRISDQMYNIIPHVLQDSKCQAVFAIKINPLPYKPPPIFLPP